MHRRGQWAPPMQDTFYMLLNQFKGQEFVLACRDADEQEAANMFVQVSRCAGVCVCDIGFL